MAEYKRMYRQRRVGTQNKNNKLRGRKGLRIWNDVIEHAVKEKQKAHNQGLQKGRMTLNVGIQKNEMRQSGLSGKATNSHGISL